MNNKQADAFANLLDNFGLACALGGVGGWHYNTLSKGYIAILAFYAILFFIGAFVLREDTENE